MAVPAVAVLTAYVGVFTVNLSQSCDIDLTLALYYLKV